MCQVLTGVQYHLVNIYSFHDSIEQQSFHHHFQPPLQISYKHFGNISISL